jgi:hypothetical protein
MTPAPQPHDARREALENVLVPMLAYASNAHRVALAEVFGVNLSESGLTDRLVDALLSSSLAVPREEPPTEKVRVGGLTVAACKHGIRLCEQCDFERIVNRAAPSELRGEPTEAEVEAGAVVVYAAMQMFSAEGKTKPWTEGGNSNAQDEARRASRTILRATLGGPDNGQ